MELCCYNHVGRFTENQPDIDSALFHLEQAAACDVLEANRELAKIYLQLPHDVLDDYIVEVKGIVFYGFSGHISSRENI